MIKVLHILKSLDVGGIETLALDCSNAGLHFGMEMHVVAIGGGGELEQAFRNSKALFSRMDKMAFPYDAIDPILVYRLRKYIKKNQIDVVHCHFADEGIHGFLAILGMKNKTLVQSFHVDFRRTRKIDVLKFRLVDCFSKVNLSCSEQLGKQLAGHKIGGSEKNLTLHNGINPGRVTGGEGKSLRDELNLGQDVVLAAMVGNFYNDTRDQLTVCRALAILIKKHPNLHFAFAGGFENRWIKKGASLYKRCVEVCTDSGIQEDVIVLAVFFKQAFQHGLGAPKP